MKYNPPKVRVCARTMCSVLVTGRQDKKYCTTKCKDNHKNQKKRDAGRDKAFDCEPVDILLHIPACSERLTTDSQERKDSPVFAGFLQYFPDAVMAVARLSKSANEKHNPNEPMRWAKEKSNDHAECLVRHLLESGTLDDDGHYHEVKVAWRAMALLQTAIEKRKQ